VVQDVPKVNDAVAVLSDMLEANLLRGHVGTLVDDLGKGQLPVAFSDDNGKAYAIVLYKVGSVLVQHYDPISA
jgi:hypothetical protein